MNPHIESHRKITVSQWKRMVSPYERADTRASIIQLLNSFGGLLVSWVAIYFSLQVSIWLALLLAIPAGGFVMRIFIIQHDCGHGSFFNSRKANDIVGSVCGVFTLVAYRYWRKGHALHHAHSADLDARGTGDIWTMTAREYLAAPLLKRIVYRVYRNPLMLFIIAPSIHFLLLQRIPPSHNDRYRNVERRSVWWNNLAILTLVVLAISLMGWLAFLIVFLPAVMVASVVGTWLFYVQHQFEDTYWAPQPVWNYTVAALSGSSYYRLPKILQWFTGNIGFHHIHHLSPRIPNYKLEQCYNDNPEFQQVVELTLSSSMKTIFLTLWDEEKGKLIRFKDLPQMQEGIST